METVDVTAYAKFRMKDQAKAALRALDRTGIPPEEIAIMLPDYDTDTEYGTSDIPKTVLSVELGALIGAAFGLFCAIFIFIIPGFVSWETRQPWIGVIGTVLMTGVGLVVGMQWALQISKKVARQIAGAGEHDILLTVHSYHSDQIQKALDILAREGGHEVALTTDDPSWRDLFERWEQVDKNAWLSGYLDPSYGR